VRLSAYDELGLLYSTSKTEFAPRFRLGSAGAPSQAIQALLTHNVNPGLQVEISTQMYDGFLYNYEDNEFIVVDDIGFRNYFLVRSRISDAFMMRFKLTHDRLFNRTNIQITSTAPYESDTRASRTAFRVQLDYMY